MGKRSKSRKLQEYSEDEDDKFINDNKSHNKYLFKFIESDDEEANEDLSLKIIEKAMSRASHAVTPADLYVTGVEDIVTTEFVESEFVKKKKKKSKKEKKAKKKKKDKSIETTDIDLATLANEEDRGDMVKEAVAVKLSETDVADNSNANNDVLRKLLRGPRYFDPPDKSWGACFNCGEEGHTAVNCTSARRKKPCFICGSLEHEVKQCQKGKDCYICKGGGHRAKDCPKKYKRSQASELCLKCGASAHAMSSCRNDYSHDDLKEIQCYVCKRFGHLCCVDYYEALSSEASCYKCGQSGHNGQECRGSHGETSAAGTSSTSCFKCGEEGHFARECTNSTKAKKRTHDFSTPTRKFSRDNNANKGYNSAPQDFNKTHTKRLQFDNGSPNWSSKSKRRGGWIPDDPSDYPPMNNGWRSPSTPNKKHKIYNLTSGGQGSSSHSSKRWSNYSSGTSSSQGYANGYQHRYSASRFGNSSNDGTRRNYDWW